MHHQPVYIASKRVGNNDALFRLSMTFIRTNSPTKYRMQADHEFSCNANYKDKCMYNGYI